VYTVLCSINKLVLFFVRGSVKNRFQIIGVFSSICAPHHLPTITPDNPEYTVLRFPLSVSFHSHYIVSVERCISQNDVLRLPSKPLHESLCSQPVGHSVGQSVARSVIQSGSQSLCQSQCREITYKSQLEFCSLLSGTTRQRSLSSRTGEHERCIC
jgi:hypothetical protein